MLKVFILIPSGARYLFFSDHKPLDTPDLFFPVDRFDLFLSIRLCPGDPILATPHWDRPSQPGASEFSNRFLDLHRLAPPYGDRQFPIERQGRRTHPAYLGFDLLTFLGNQAVFLHGHGRAPLHPGLQIFTPDRNLNRPNTCRGFKLARQPAGPLAQMVPAHEDQRRRWPNGPPSGTGPQRGLGAIE